ncbi:peritrophin-1 isoform X2 [Parasteatoda tepidariorum]|uniref:peritrophin-1 isoform X2 n=1 Tax=Parasteatoda tepidariorum TaxID=114398 RepID=UPI001C7234F2|nr:probable endochitinase isoform X2 [Parasteatoda tepidariorum]
MLYFVVFWGLLQAFSTVEGATTNPCEGKEGCIIPNPEVDDCTSYIRCAKDTSYEVLTCSTGLLFNALKRTCDYNTSVNCPAEDVPPEETENRISIPSSDVQCETDTCTCVYPSEHSCSEYYRCENGIAYKEECPKGLNMNKQKLTCDYEENVDCCKYF